MPGKVKETKSACLLNLENGDILDRSIERLLKEDTEVLVVDNNSHDITPQVLKKYKKHPKVKIWQWDEIKGQSFNRNLMIKNATGQYILLLDADILYIPKSFDYLIERLKNASPEIKCVGFDPWYYTNKEEEADTKPPSLDAPLSFKGQPIALTQYGVFDRDIFYRYDIWFDENFGTGYGGEDNDLGIQMLMKGLKCACVPCKYFHNKHTVQWWTLHTPSFMRIKERQDYLIQKWGKDVYERFYDHKPAVSDDQASLFKLFEDGNPELIKKLSEEQKQMVLSYLKVLETYKAKNYQKYETKKQEFVQKLFKKLYENS